MRLRSLTTCLTILAFVTACDQQSGEENRADVYKASETNHAQESKIVDIKMILPARIEVENVHVRQGTQVVGTIVGVIVGALLGTAVTKHNNDGALIGGLGGGASGAALGSLVPGKVLVDGVSITYETDGRTMSSAQVARPCEYQTGKAVVISGAANETRIQPNAICPPPPGGVTSQPLAAGTPVAQ